MEVSYGAYQEWRKQNNVFEDIAVVSSVNLDMPLTGGAEPQQVESTIVSHPFFPTLGVKARLGRIFAAGDDRPGASNVVISSRLWRSRFGASSDHRQDDAVGYRIGDDHRGDAGRLRFSTRRRCLGS